MRKVIPVILLCLMLPAAAGTTEHGNTGEAEKWTQVELWRHNLRKGMTEADVFSVFGKPKDMEVIRRIMTWYFQEPIERINAEVTHRPECGIVKFSATRLRNSRQPVFLVIEWKEPDWEQLKRIADAKAAEIAAAEAEAERLKAEQARKAAELEQAELAKQRARQQMEQERARMRQQEAEAAKSSIVDRIIMKVKEPDKDTFIYGGIGLVVLVVFVSILVKKPW